MHVFELDELIPPVFISVVVSQAHLLTVYLTFSLLLDVNLSCVQVTLPTLHAKLSPCDNSSHGTFQFL